MAKLSLVIPCYNEARNLPALLDRCGVLAGHDIEVLLVDNGSTDGTAELLASHLPDHPHIRSVRVPQNQGYGHGILAGLQAAKGEFLAWTHADLQTDPADALKGLEFFRQDSDATRLFVKGRRYGRPAADVIFTAGMSIFETLLLRRPLWDINAQPTMFSRRFFESWGSPPHDFSLDLYGYYSAKAEQIRVKRFPVRFGERQHGVSHWNINWRAKLKFIRRTMQYSFALKREMIR